MAIDRLGTTSSLIGALASELRRTERSAGGAPAPGTRSGAQREAETTPSSAQSLRDLAAQAVRNVDIHDPEALRAARRRLIRAVLTSRLGPDVREHAQWQPMVESIEAALERDARHQRQFLALVAELQQDNATTRAP